MKKLLIISPYFPPVNAADMQRVRMSLSYFTECGWEAEVVSVDPAYADISKDKLLLKSIPAGIKIHNVKAFDKNITAKLGLGSIALRSLYFYNKKVSALLQEQIFDLIYFSTTQFPVCILGARWKKKFGIPYVIDMQDPWHSEYYRDKPKDQRPPKYWFSYNLNKRLEPIAIKNCDGLISVSEAYITDLKNRYPQIAHLPSSIITFGAFAPDLKIAADDNYKYPALNERFTNVVYIGRGGNDMHNAIAPLFEALKTGLAAGEQILKQLRFYFIGTSYAAAGKGKPTILPLAAQYGLTGQVFEDSDRMSYYHTLSTLQQADALFVPGSNDPKYSASKIYPYLLTQKPILAIFNSASPAISIMKEFGAKYVYDYESVSTAEITAFFKILIEHKPGPQIYNAEAEQKYSAKQMTIEQCRLFDTVTSA